MNNKFKIQHKRPRKTTTKTQIRKIYEIVICYSINSKSTVSRRVSLDTALPAERYCKFVIECDYRVWFEPHPIDTVGKVIGRAVLSCQ